MKKGKMIFMSTLLSSLILLNGTCVFAMTTTTKATIRINNMIQPMTSSIINKNGHTLIAFRELFDMLNIDVDWNGAKRIITAQNGDIILSINIDSSEATVNGEQQSMPTNIEIIDGSTYIPLRFVCETFGMDVEWVLSNKEILVTKGDGEYLLLDDVMNEDNIKIMGYDEALKIAISNDEGIKKADENLLIAEKQLQESKNKLTSYLLGGSSEIISYLGEKETIYRAEQSILTKKDNKKIMIDAIEPKLLSAIATVEQSKFDIISLESGIEIEKINVKNLELKLEYGLISSNSVETAKRNQINSETAINALNLKLEQDKKNLRDLIGIDYDVIVTGDIKGEFSDMDNIDINEYLIQEPESNIAIDILERNLETERYVQKNYTYNRPEIVELTDNQQIKDTQRIVEDAKSNMRDKIDTDYNNLKLLKDKDETLNIDLTKAISDYNITTTNYINGKITISEVNQAKMQVINAERTIEQNKTAFNIALFMFNNQHL